MKQHWSEAHLLTALGFRMKIYFVKGLVVQYYHVVMAALRDVGIFASALVT